MSKAEKVYWKLPPEYKRLVAEVCRKKQISQSQYIAGLIKADQSDSVAATLPDLIRPGNPRKKAER